MPGRQALPHGSACLVRQQVSAPVSSPHAASQQVRAAGHIQKQVCSPAAKEDIQKSIKSLTSCFYIAQSQLPLRLCGHCSSCLAIRNSLPLCLVLLSKCLGQALTCPLKGSCSLQVFGGSSVQLLTSSFLATARLLTARLLSWGLKVSWK